jgi:fido (protein-threonine AMPylation protein)
MDGNKSRHERAEELRYRAERMAAMDAEFGRLVAADVGMEDAIRELHRILNRGKRYRNVHRLAKLFFRRGYEPGQYRRTPQRGADYVAPRPVDIVPLMGVFARRLDTLAAEPLDDAQTRVVCGWALAMMIRIHPFADGNGRTTRALLNLLLAREGHETVAFPSDGEIYKRSPLWSRFKDHMRLVRDELGWSLRAGSIPPPGYFHRLRASLEQEASTATVERLSQRPDIVAIADALEEVRRGGFAAYIADLG